MTLRNASAVISYRRTSRARGFTLFELAVTVSVIGVLIVVFLGRVSFYRDEAARLAFEQTVTALRAEVRLRVLALTIAGKRKDIPALAGQNPMNWLAQKPANYLGEFYSPDTKKFASGNWFFDRSNGLLVYLLNPSNIFDANDSELLKFNVSLSAGSDGVVGPMVTPEFLPVQVREEIAVK